MKTITLPVHEVLARGSEGPFLCAICEYFTGPTTCHHPYIRQHFGGTVGDDWCCDFFHKTGGRALGKMEPRQTSTGSV